MAALQTHQRLLLENREILLREVRTDDVCPLLFVNGVLAQKEIDEIEIGRSWRERAESLLDLLHYKGEPGFREFCTVLEDTYPHLATKLQARNATVEAERDSRTEPQRHNLSDSHWTREESARQPSRSSENLRRENIEDDRGKMRGERQYGRNFSYDAYVDRKRESPRYGSDEGRRDDDRNLATDRSRGHQTPSPPGSDLGSRRDAEPLAGEQFVWERQTIVLEKANAKQGFGIAVSGGQDNPHFRSGETSIVVSDIVPGSPADGLLRVNDVILQVNHTNVENVMHSDAVLALKESGNSARLIIRRMKAGTVAGKKDISDATTVRLVRDVNEGYGFSLGQRLFIKELAPNGLARREATLEPGDVVLKINDKWCDKVSLREAIDQVRQSSTSLELLVVKRGIQVTQHSTHSLPPSYRHKQKEKQDEQDHGVQNGYSDEHEPQLPPRLYGNDSPKPERPPPPDEQGKQTPFSDMGWKRPDTGERVGLQDDEIHMDRMQTVESQPHVPRAAEVTLTADGLRDISHDGWDRSSRSGYNESISSSPRSERRDMDTLERRRYRDESRLVAFRKSGSLGIQVQGGNKNGIFVAAVKEGSSAYRQGLRKGDQIFVANDIDFKDITREEAVLILLSLGEEVSLLCQYKRPVFEKISKEPGDSFYIKTHFDYEKMKQEELEFQREDVFHVWDTMYNGVIGTWHAQRVTKSNVETETGVIPNKCRAEQLAQVRIIEEGKSLQRGGGAYSSLKRSSSRGGTLKKFKFVSSDHLDEESFVNTVREFKLPAYERVSLRHPGFIRPVVLLGPIADITRDKLLQEMPDTFAIPTAFGGTLPRGREAPTKARRRSINYSSIKSVLESGKHCLLDITPEEIERMNYAQLYPIVIFLKPPNKMQIKEMRTRHSSDNHSTKYVKKLYENARKLEELSGSMFTAVVHAGPMDTWYANVKDEIKKQQNDSVWMSEDKFEEQTDLTFQMANRHSTSQYDYDSTLDSPRTMRSSSSGPVDEDVVAVAEPIRDVHNAPPSDVRVRPAYSEPYINFNGPDRETEPKPYYEDDYRYGQNSYEEDIQKASKPGYKPYGNVVKVLPSSKEPVELRMSLKKTNMVDSENRVEPDGEELRLKRQSLRKVEPESDLLREYDERVGAPLSELYAIDKESAQRREQIDQGRVRDSPVEVVKETKKSSFDDLEQRLEDLESTVSPRYSERKPRPKSESYNMKPRNIVVDHNQPSKPETIAVSSYFPTRSYATRVDSSKTAEPEVRASVYNKVESVPNSVYGGDRGGRQKSDVIVPTRRPEQPRPKSSTAYVPKPFNAERNSYSDFSLDQISRRGGSEPPRPDQPVTYNFRLSSRQQGDSPKLSRPGREPEPRPTTYRTEYRPKILNQDQQHEDGQNVVTSDFESLDEETQVVATARGKFTSQGGVLSSPESGVSIVIPEGAIPNGVEQEIYFKVCKDNNFMPPLDADRGETLLSPLVMCGPHGTQFLKPVELRLPHCASMTPDGWSFALKSSDTPTDQPSQWKNVTLQGKDGRPDQCQVDSNSVSVLVDHFSLFSLVGRSLVSGQPSRKRPAKRMLAAVFAIPPRLNSDWLLNVVLLDDIEAAFKDVCNSEASVGRFPFSSFKPILVHGDSGDVKVLLRDLNKNWIVRSVCKQFIEFHHTWEAFREPPCAEFMIRDKNFVRGPGVCSVEICQEGHPNDATTLDVTIRPRKVNGDSRVEYLI